LLRPYAVVECGRSKPAPLQRCARQIHGFEVGVGVLADACLRAYGASPAGTPATTLQLGEITRGA